MTVLSHQRRVFDQVVTSRTAVPEGFDRTLLPEALAEKVAAYDDLLADLGAAAVEAARLEAAIQEGRARDLDDEVQRVREGKKASTATVTHEDRARAKFEAHRRHVAAVERVADEAGRALERQAALSLADLEASAQRPEADARSRAALVELRAALTEREHARTALHWFRDLAEQRPPKARSGDAAVEVVLRPVEDLLRR